jgi:hypothetical protein
MNSLHVLARNCIYSGNVINILKNVAEKRPELLNVRMVTGNEDLNMTPVEMVIRTSYNEDLMVYMLEKYQGQFEDNITLNDQQKLLRHAAWLTGSGISSTSLMGQRIVEQIKLLSIAKEL